ncbi:MAG: C1 family peptidase [Rhizobiaceae bacterium]
MLLDARPDRIDFRDREFRSQLVSLPEKYPTDQQIGLFLEQYQQKEMILNQGSDGACTGFGLAAVINYLKWYRDAVDHWTKQGISHPTELPDPPPKVSAWMIYNTARLYDEWEGEDYSGSSCRGAMKGWHKHGVCTQDLWPRSGPGDDDSWSQNSARRPLGAYYRVDVQSISDMQAAIYEVGAVYCSARVHSGWFFDELTEAPKTEIYRLNENGQATERSLPIIDLSSHSRGGHAFAVVGYNARGFIVQNSWGPDWAKSWGRPGTTIPFAAGGFALVTYEDWVLNAHDAWVAALAAPMLVSEIAKSPVTQTDRNLLEQAAQGLAEQHLRASQTPGSLGRWPESTARQHCIEMGNDGKLIRGRIDSVTAYDGLRKSMDQLLKQYQGRDVMIFAHGGLNNRDGAIRRAQKLGPWFEANGILPIFIVWRTGFGESLVNIGKDFINETFPALERAERRRVEKFFGQLASQIKERSDRGFEVLAEKFMGKAVWSQMKQNAEAANKRDATSDVKGGMRELADYLRKRLKTDRPDLRLHLLGHSAGSIILGHFARDLAQFTNIASLGLLAPACTLKFANKHFLPLVKAKKLDAGKFYIANLSRKNERADRVGPYNKSLLYLVSRAFEVPRKTPLLGLDDSWILDCELDGVGDQSPKVAEALGGVDTPLHQTLLIAKLGPYYALTGRKELPEFVKKPSKKSRKEQLDILAKLHDLDSLSDLKVPKQILKRMNLKALQKRHGIHDVLTWRVFAASHPFVYRLHVGQNVQVQRIGDISAFEPTAHGNIDNDVEIMDWAMSHMIGSPKIPATDLRGS